MKISATLSQYLARTYIFNFAFLLFALLSIVYLFDTVELIRRASKFTDVPMGVVLQMGFLKLPEVGQILMPFAILFSAMFTCWQLTKRSELIVVRSAGFSAWQFLTPLLIVACFIGLLQMSVINPLGALLLGKFERMEQQLLDREQSEIALFKDGLWLRQNIIPTVSDKNGYVILYAQSVDQPDWALNNVSVFFFNGDNKFYKRIISDDAKLTPGYWTLGNAKVFESSQDPAHISFFKLPTDLTITDIEESFSSPETMSFWRLPSHIKTLEETGFNAQRLRVHYQNLLSQPLMFMAMVLLAATVSMRPPRFRGAAMLFGIGIFMGFAVFFISSFLQALGASGQIPVFLAAWSPALITTLLGVSVMMNLEDG